MLYTYVELDLLQAKYCSGGSQTEGVPGPDGVGHSGQRLRPPHWSNLLTTKVQLLGAAGGNAVPAGC